MIILKNEGEIELELITTMGVNVKETDSPIGFFGTGLKFAIATFLREGIEFCMYRGEHKYTFGTEEVTIRGKVFNKCYMFGPSDATYLGFATDMGRNWEIWQAYREIHSNCLDEGGEIFEQDEFTSGTENFTTFVIETPIDVKGVFLEKTVSERVFRDSRIEIFKGESNVVYYKGIRAKDLNKPSLYTYNILRYCTLTEDRSLCYDHDIEDLISESVSRMEDKKIIKNVITAEPKNYEHRIRPSTFSPAPKKAFQEACKEVTKKVNSQFKEHLERHTPKPPRTDAEKKQDFLVNLRELCDQYQVELKEHTDADGDYKELRNGVINNE